MSDKLQFVVFIAWIILLHNVLISVEIVLANSYDSYNDREHEYENKVEDNEFVELPDHSFHHDN